MTNKNDNARIANVRYSRLKKSLDLTVEQHASLRADYSKLSEFQNHAQVSVQRASRSIKVLLADRENRKLHGELFAEEMSCLQREFAVLRDYFKDHVLQEVVHGELVDDAYWVNDGSRIFNPVRYTDDEESDNAFADPPGIHAEIN